MIFWVLSIGLAGVALLLFVFIVISRKRRELRKAQLLPPPARKAYMSWAGEGTTKRIEIETPFYFGKNSDSNVVLPDARADYEACIFYHNRRFAIQTLEGAGELQVNGEEMMAGYLRDGDSILIARQKFTFHCF